MSSRRTGNKSLKALRAPKLHLSKTTPSSAFQEALTPIAQPRVQLHGTDFRQGNLSQPELSITNRNSLVQTANSDFAPRGPTRPRKKIILDRRLVPQVAPPTSKKPTSEDVYISEEGRQFVNHEYLKNHFGSEGRLKVEHALDILEQAANLFARESNLVSINSPVTICGDLHGQYYDLMQIFAIGGSVKNNRYVFLGNYINHGFFGIETIIYLYALKLRYPKQIVLLRGSHECREVAEYFHFRTECLHKYTEEVYEACLRSFRFMPFAALVDDRVFCVHGGISPQLQSLDNIDTIPRFDDPRQNGLLLDLLWSEPSATYGSHDANSCDSSEAFSANTNQGRGYFYSYAVVCDFLSRNNLYTMIRGNDIHATGYNMHRPTARNFPSIISIFSAPNYLDKHGNFGSILQYMKGSTTITTFKAKPHPYWLPHFSNVFAWSLPYINTQFSKMLSAIMDVDDSDIDARPLAERKGVIQKKIIAIGRFSLAMRVSRETPGKTQTSSVPGKDDDIPSDIQRISSRGTFTSASRTRCSTPYSMPTQRDSTIFNKKSAGQKDPTHLHRFLKKMIPGGRSTESGGFNKRIKTKIMAIGKLQLLWKSTSASAK